MNSRAADGGVGVDRVGSTGQLERAAAAGGVGTSIHQAPTAQQQRPTLRINRAGIVEGAEDGAGACAGLAHQPSVVQAAAAELAESPAVVEIEGLAQGVVDRAAVGERARHDHRAVVVDRALAQARHTGDVHRRAVGDGGAASAALSAADPSEQAAVGHLQIAHPVQGGELPGQLHCGNRGSAIEDKSAAGNIRGRAIHIGAIDRQRITSHRENIIPRHRQTADSVRA